MFGTVASLLPHVRAGRLRVLGVTSTTLHPDLPKVPTIADSGMPGFEVISWQGMCTPAGVPKAVLARIRTGLDAALALPATLKALTDQGMQPTPLAHEKFAAFIRSERAKWAKVVKDVGIEPR
jgi:tripartite-type tricarboxylate transporter receptor subunit TctC